MAEKKADNAIQIACAPSPLFYIIKKKRLAHNISDLDRTRVERDRKETQHLTVYGGKIGLSTEIAIVYEALGDSGKRVAFVPRSS